MTTHNIADITLPIQLIFLVPAGFNCGEAVNFAIAEWFSFGAAASERYALLGKMPIISYEELLCAEAMLLPKSLAHKPYCTADSIDVRCVMTSFSCLLRSYHRARRCLEKLKTSLRTCSKPQGSFTCILCNRLCYVAYLECKCYAGPICLFHGTRAKLLNIIYRVQ